ncbi:MAG TPA: error-prone DNA polymerase [Rhodocyclaceae bacterium]|nr:error-prone DNA polymerase [Rhodocyclaceae bacterium]
MTDVLPVHLPNYAELHCLSNFSFLRGASHSRELIARAIEMGYRALAVTDECSVAGVVRAFEAMREAEEIFKTEGRELDFKLIIGTEITLTDGMKLVLLAKNREGYGNLSALITLGRRKAEKGQYQLSRNDLEWGCADCLALWIPDAQASAEDGLWLAQRFPARAWIAFERHLEADDAERLTRLRELEEACGLPLVAAGDVHMHVRERRPLQDMMTALRLNTSIDQAGFALFPNGERHLRTRLQLGRLYPQELLSETLRVAEQCTFCLSELKYEYPEEVVPKGMTPSDYLRQETYAGLAERYPDGASEKIIEQIEKELVLIAQVEYEAYFLTVYDIVKFSRSQNILCQGRGSAANSAVCYALGITAVDPTRTNLLFGRFISIERNEPPDIDVDFEHQRREEVIQYVFNKYGRSRTALVATVISYRSRSALRDAGRALGIDADKLTALTSSMAWWDTPEQWPERFAEVGLDPESPRIKKWLQLAPQLKGMPRHLSQHVGGFVISRGRLDRLVPIENAAMVDRNVIQWDKDDIDVLGLMKVDVLALGMLSAIRKSLDWVSWQRQEQLLFHQIPKEDAKVYEMICKADTVGVFQIESRAQMSMLPRLRPIKYYDLVVQVAIVRPGPIQGDMVHPYLQRRELQRNIPNYKPDDLRPELESALGRTLGIPIFQEQVMQIAMIAADFTPGEADQLRRAMAAWKRKGGLGKFEEKLKTNMLKNGYTPDFCERIYHQMEGFGDYGFPESHAASFALLVYDSAWLKCHYPEAFLTGMLNALPMGFYSASQLVQDARRHHVDVRPVDVMHSDWESTLEANDNKRPSVRLGLHQVSGLSSKAGEEIAAARRQKAFRDAADLSARARLQRKDMDALVAANALNSLSGHRRQAAWASAAVPVRGDLLTEAPLQEETPLLRAPSEAENLVADYASLSLTLGRHPMQFLRQPLRKHHYQSAVELRQMPHNQVARCVGLVTGRQRPGTATGVIFVTLEDETGMTNVIVHADLAEVQRKELLGSQLLGVRGMLQREGEVVHLIAKYLVDHTELLGSLSIHSRDFQ